MRAITAATNVQHLMDHGIPAMIADNQMRQRDERFKDQGKHKAKKDPLYDKQPTDGDKPIKLFKLKMAARNTKLFQESWP